MVGVGGPGVGGVDVEVEEVGEDGGGEFGGQCGEGGAAGAAEVDGQVCAQGAVEGVAGGTTAAASSRCRTPDASTRCAASSRSTRRTVRTSGCIGYNVVASTPVAPGQRHAAESRSFTRERP